MVPSARPCKWTSRPEQHLPPQTDYAFCQRHNGVHFAGHTRVMDRHDTRVLSVIAASINVSSMFMVSGEHPQKRFLRHAAQRHWQWNKGVARHDHFIARLDIEQQRAISSEAVQDGVSNTLALPKRAPATAGSDG